MCLSVVNTMCNARAMRRNGRRVLPEIHLGQLILIVRSVLLGNSITQITEQESLDQTLSYLTIKRIPCYMDDGLCKKGQYTMRINCKLSLLANVHHITTDTNARNVRYKAHYTVTIFQILHLREAIFKEAICKECTQGTASLIVRCAHLEITSLNDEIINREKSERPSVQKPVPKYLKTCGRRLRRPYSLECLFLAASSCVNENKCIVLCVFLSLATINPENQYTKIGYGLSLRGEN